MSMWYNQTQACPDIYRCIVSSSLLLFTFCYFSSFPIGFPQIAIRDVSRHDSGDIIT